MDLGPVLLALPALTSTPIIHSAFKVLWLWMPSVLLNNSKECVGENGVNSVHSEEFAVYNESHAIFPEQLAFPNDDI